MGIETPHREEHHVTSLDFRMSTLTADPELPERFRPAFADLLPALRDATWESEKVGLLTFSMDIEPIVGRVARFPGLYVATAFHSGGFAYNPVMGELLAEFVIDGKTRIDVSAYSPDRFAPAVIEEYLAMTVRQENVTGKRH
jgi:glycine/D-amino acid oxidase-like deaminating enzyme